MARLTRAEMNELAADREAVIPQLHEAVYDADRVAADPSVSQYERDVAVAAARVHRGNVAIYREEASAYRDGVDPYAAI